jgi:hypothetical protein
VRAETRWIFAFFLAFIPSSPGRRQTQLNEPKSQFSNSNSNLRQNCLGKTNAPASSSGVVHAAGSFPRLPSTSPVRTSFLAIDGPRLGLRLPCRQTPSPPHSIATCAGNERERCWRLFPFQTTRHRWSRPGISTARPTISDAPPPPRRAIMDVEMVPPGQPTMVNVPPPQHAQLGQDQGMSPDQPHSEGGPPGVIRRRAPIACRRCVCVSNCSFVSCGFCPSRLAAGWLRCVRIPAA